VAAVRPLEQEATVLPATNLAAATLSAAFAAAAFAAAISPERRMRQR